MHAIHSLVWEKIRGSAVSKYILNLANTEVVSAEIKMNSAWTINMASHVKAKPDGLSSAPGPHVVGGERESNDELNMNGDLGKGDILPSHLFKKICIK